MLTKMLESKDIGAMAVSADFSSFTVIEGVEGVPIENGRHSKFKIVATPIDAHTLREAIKFLKGLYDLLTQKAGTLPAQPDDNENDVKYLAELYCKWLDKVIPTSNQDKNALKEICKGILCHLKRLLEDDRSEWYLKRHSGDHGIEIPDFKFQSIETCMETLEGLPAHRLRNFINNSIAYATGVMLNVWDGLHRVGANRLFLASCGKFDFENKTILDDEGVEGAIVVTMTTKLNLRSRTPSTMDEEYLVRARDLSREVQHQISLAMKHSVREFFNDFFQMSEKKYRELGWKYLFHPESPFWDSFGSKWTDDPESRKVGSQAIRDLLEPIFPDETFDLEKLQEFLKSRDFLFERKGSRKSQRQSGSGLGSKRPRDEDGEGEATEVARLLRAEAIPTLYILIWAITVIKQVLLPALQGLDKKHMKTAAEENLILGGGTSSAELVSKIEPDEFVRRVLGSPQTKSQTSSKPWHKDNRGNKLHSFTKLEEFDDEMDDAPLTIA